MGHLARILALFILATVATFSQEYPIADFVEIKVPKVNSKEWFNLNYSRSEFKVLHHKGAIKITKVDEERDAILEIEGGQLIGSDHGEWGGKIEFVANGTNDKKLIKEGNVKFVLRFNLGIYFIEGLAHMSISRGAMFRLDNSNGTFSPIKVIEFEDAPEAMTILGDIIFTHMKVSLLLRTRIRKQFSRTPSGQVCIQTQSP